MLPKAEISWFTGHDHSTEKLWRWRTNKYRRTPVLMAYIDGRLDGTPAAEQVPYLGNEGREQADVRGMIATFSYRRRFPLSRCSLHQSRLIFLVMVIDRETLSWVWPFCPQKQQQSTFSYRNVARGQPAFRAKGLHLQFRIQIRTKPYFDNPPTRISIPGTKWKQCFFLCFYSKVCRTCTRGSAVIYQIHPGRSLWEPENIEQTA